MTTRQTVEKTQSTTGTAGNLDQALYPHEFVGVLCDNATHTLAGYLRKIGAPEAAIDLALSISFLAIYETRARLTGDRATGVDNDLITDLVPTVTREIVTLGGVFETGYGSSIPRDVPDLPTH